MTLAEDLRGACLTYCTQWCCGLTSASLSIAAYVEPKVLI